MSEINEENLRYFVEASIKKFNERIAFVKELHEDERDFKFEALLLCCCYIDGLASLWHPQNKGRSDNKWRFVKIIREFGGVEELCLVDPKELITKLEKSKKREDKIIINKIRKTINNMQGQLFTKDEIINRLGSQLSGSDLNRLEKKLWMGTLAAIAYEWLRCPPVHEFAGLSGVIFPHTTFKGRSVPPIDLDMLYKCLKSIFDKAKAKYLELVVGFETE